MKNERGYTLVLVLLVSLVFVTAGLTIFSITINGAKHTEIRKNDVITTQKSIEEMNEVIADFKGKVSALSLQGLSKSEYTAKIASIKSELTNKYTAPKDSPNSVLTIKDQALADHADPNKSPDLGTYFTRYYEFALVYVNDANSAHPEITKTIKRKVLISPTPSFLQYAVGSENTLNLNGASDVVGNVYGETVNLANQARYANALISSGALEYLPKFTTQDTLYPSIRGDLVINKELDIYKDTTSADGSKTSSTSSHLLSLKNPKDFTPYFYKNSNPPIIRKPYDSFTSVDFRQTFADKLNKLSPGLNIKKEDVPSTGGILNPTDEQLRNAIVQKIQSNPSVYVMDKSGLPFNFTTGIPSSKTAILITDSTSTSSSIGTGTGAADAGKKHFVIDSDVTLNDNQWLIVNGDLEIYSNKKPLSIQGNILVMGDLVIRGNAYDFEKEQDSISFDSTIYATGKASIYSTDIIGKEDKQLVLLCQDDLLITRINEFKSTNDNAAPIDAYFYTDKNAELYGVGSLFKIHGGLFAKQELTINAVRQDTFGTLGNLLSATDQVISLPLESRALQEDQKSRFVVEYDKSVVLDQMDALPYADKLQTIIEDYTIESGKQIEDDAP
ncbi:hypothetical protein [Ectobacillus panaciterrae]|uniref:hypothetical protein n=1 Tax=Ectobacillus panaciterrae TaxID=363872 RepID=UPI0004085B81|nr:hypothetical protein [Ectobacillus panaciterrae]